MLALLRVIDLTISIYMFPLDLLRGYLRLIINFKVQQKLAKKYEGKSNEEILKELYGITSIKQEETTITKTRKKKLAVCKECGTGIYNLSIGCKKCNKVGK